MTLHIVSRPRKIEENYEQRVNRDKRAKDLLKLGYEVKRRSMRGQTMHPDYIKDYDGEGKGTNFRENPYYRTYFAVVYIVEATKKEKLFGYE